MPGGFHRTAADVLRLAASVDLGGDAGTGEDSQHSAERSPPSPVLTGAARLAPQRELLCEAPFTAIGVRHSDAGAAGPV